MRKNKLRKFLIILLIMVLPVPVYADYGSIEIDGFYDDWEDKPHTEVYEGKNPPPGKINYVSLFRDEYNAYVHIEYARKNNQTITNMRVNLYTNLGNARYNLVPDFDFDMFDYDDETDFNNMENISPDADPNDANLNDGTEGDTDSNNTENNAEIDNGNVNGNSNSQDNGNGSGSGNSQDNGNSSNDNGNGSNSNNTNDSTDSRTDSNKEDTNTDESQQSDQILAGKAEEILIAVKDTDETADNGQDKKDSTTVDSTNDQGNSTDTTDSTESQGNNTDTTDSGSNNGQDKKDNTDTTDSNSNTDQSNENDGTNPDTIIDPLDLFDPDAIIDLEDFLDSLDPINTDLDGEWNPLDPNNGNDLGGEWDPFDPDNNNDQEDQEDPQDPESDWNFHHPGYYGTWPFTVYQGHDEVGYGYFTRSEGEPDEAEFYIPLDTITDEVDGITEISMTIKKLGKQSVICVGASTAPYIGIAISSAIVLMSVAGYSYKKQRPLILKKGIK